MQEFDLILGVRVVRRFSGILFLKHDHVLGIFTAMNITKTNLFIFTIVTNALYIFFILALF